MTALRDRARGALYGLAIGDALGMPTQSFPRKVIVDRYGNLVARFEPGPSDQPLAPDMIAGSVTDDTEQALLLARLLIETGGTVPPEEWAHRLLAWEDSMRARGSLDLLGPSTRRALDDLLAGVDPQDSGRAGTTNGAAMRITPVGIATPPGERLIERTVAASRVTHNTGVALAGAAAVAAAVSVALDGGDLLACTAQAVDAARQAEELGHWVAAAAVADRIEWAVRVVAGLPPDSVPDVIDRLIGTSLASQESVPAAFAVLHSAPDDAWTVARLGASIGGDCDTIAAMASAMAGARLGIAGFPADVIARVEQVNALGVDDVADGLLALRAAE